MKNRYLFLCLLFIIAACTTLNKSIIENADRSIFQPLVLIPSYDIYDIRIDIIRQTLEKQVNDSTTKDEKTPYHPVGFYLGNGLFIDLDDNLSLLVPKLFHINCTENFTIKKITPGFLLNSIITYEKADSLFITKNEGLIETSTKKIITKKDSVVFVKDGLFSQYKIIESDSTLAYQSFLVNTVIHKYNEGYINKSLLWRREYRILDNEIFVGKKYVIRSHGDLIEIFDLGFLNNEYLKYRIIKADNRIYIYDRDYRGLEIIMTENNINVLENTTNLNSYSIE